MPCTANAASQIVSAHREQVERNEPQTICCLRVTLEHRASHGCEVLGGLVPAAGEGDEFPVDDHSGWEILNGFRSWGEAYARQTTRCCALS